MLNKIIAIKNIGRFRNCGAVGNVALKKNTIVLGGNGYGKTTLCAILRSLQANDSSHIVGRKTVDSGQHSTVELLLDGGAVKFDGRSWSAPYPNLMIFDNEFVAQNVHSGEVVDIGHKRNLYRVIIGEAGVRLARQEADVTKQSRDKTAEIKALENEIRRAVPPGIRLEAFMGLPADHGIDKRIENQERNVRAHQVAHELAQRPPLAGISIPHLPEDFGELLARTVDDISEDAEARLAEHVTGHGMGVAGRNWIAAGLQHTDGESCPFCGQGIRGLPIIGAYRSVFSDEYKALKVQISAMRREIDQRFGERAIGLLGTQSERNRGAAEFWGRYCEIDPARLALPPDLLEAIRGLRQAATTLLDRKAQAPLEAIETDGPGLTSALGALRDARSRARDLASAITAANELIEQRKRQAGPAREDTARAELKRLKAIKDRHSHPVAGHCAKHGRLSSEKRTLERTEGAASPEAQRLHE